MPILPKGTSAITKWFPKAACDYMNMFLEAARVDNLPSNYFWRLSETFHIANSGIQKPFSDRTSHFTK
jgi:hypothetical protein